MSKKQSILKYDAAIYTPRNLRTMFNTKAEQKELRAEYKRLQKVAQGRLERLAKSEFSETEAYLQNKNAFPKISKVSAEDLPERLTKLADFIEAQTSTVTGQKKKRAAYIKTINDKLKSEVVTKENYLDFVNFFDDLAAINKGVRYSSEQIVDAIAIINDKGIDFRTIKKDFNWWIEHQREVRKLDTSGLETVDAKTVRKAITNKSKGKRRK